MYTLSLSCNCFYQRSYHTIQNAYLLLIIYFSESMRIYDNIKIYVFNVFITMH